MTFVVCGSRSQICPVVLVAAVVLISMGSALRAAEPSSADAAVIRWSEDAAGRIRETLRGGTVVERTVVPWDPAPKLSEERLWRFAEAVYLAPGATRVAPRGDSDGEPRPPDVHVVAVDDPACAARFVVGMRCETSFTSSIAVAAVNDDGGRVRVLGRAVFGVASSPGGWVDSFDLKLLSLQQGRFVRLRAVKYEGTSGLRVESQSYTLIQLSAAGRLTLVWTGVPCFETVGSHWAEEEGDPMGRGQVHLLDLNGDGFEDVLLTREDRATAPVEGYRQDRPAFDDPAMKRIASVRRVALWGHGRFQEEVSKKAGEAYPYADWCEVLE